MMNSPRAAANGNGPRRNQRLARLAAIALAIVSILADRVISQSLPMAAPHEVGLDPDRLSAIERLVHEGLAQQRMPGCVIAVGRHGRLAWLQAYGDKQLEPVRLPMTTDTVFDLASITKPVATATSIMILVEQGRLRLRDKVIDHWPEFEAGGKESITIEQLLTHQAGLIADNPLADYEAGPETAWTKIAALTIESPPGTQFVYSDVGYLVLGELVRRVSGQDVDTFSQTQIFARLGMHDTRFHLDENQRRRAAPTEKREEKWIQGTVHDPRAERLGGVAGHAGLFSTASDLAIYAQMMIERGSFQGERILSPRMVDVMTQAYRAGNALRGLGWDKQSGYSSNRAELFTPEAFGHGGFTGTVLWIDPGQDLFFIFLSNRVHPNGQGNVNGLAGRIATVIASSVIDAPRVPATSPAPNSVDSDALPKLSDITEVQTGLDNLESQDYRPLIGRKVGLITNQTGVNRRGQRNIDLFRQQQPRFPLVAIFSPEHGVRGDRDEPTVPDDVDQVTGVPIYSLYGATRQPTAEQLSGVDTLVFDIQDAGTRFYTYISTLGLAMESAAKLQKRFVVLDRPNPINGIDVDGPVLDEGLESFVGFHTLPIRHGMTVGEMAKMFQAERMPGLELEVVPLRNWHRHQFFDATTLPWTDPSPNLRSVHQALLYPGVGSLETTNVSVGRGTDTPFERIGAPWIDARGLAIELQRAQLAGVRFVPIEFRPSSSTFANTTCHGVQIVITNRDTINPLDVGWELALALHRLHPSQWRMHDYQKLLADAQVFHALDNGAARSTVRGIYAQELQTFRARRQQFLLYSP